jgi:hypothetical protein
VGVDVALVGTKDTDALPLTAVARAAAAIKCAILYIGPATDNASALAVGLQMTDLLAQGPDPGYQVAVRIRTQFVEATMRRICVEDNFADLIRSNSALSRGLPLSPTVYIERKRLLTLARVQTDDSPGLAVNRNMLLISLNEAFDRLANTVAKGHSPRARGGSGSPSADAWKELSDGPLDSLAWLWTSPHRTVVARSQSVAEVLAALAIAGFAKVPEQHADLGQLIQQAVAFAAQPEANCRKGP